MDVIGAEWAARKGLDAPPPEASMPEACPICGTAHGLCTTDRETAAAQAEEQ